MTSSWEGRGQAALMELTSMGGHPRVHLHGLVPWVVSMGCPLWHDHINQPYRNQTRQTHRWRGCLSTVGAPGVASWLVELGCRSWQELRCSRSVWRHAGSHSGHATRRFPPPLPPSWGAFQCHFSLQGCSGFTQPLLGASPKCSQTKDFAVNEMVIPWK